MRRPTTAALAALALAAAPATALAGPTLDFGVGGSPDIVTDANGTSYIVWDESNILFEGSSTSDGLHFCVLPARASACSINKVLAASSAGGPHVILDAQAGVDVIARVPVAGQNNTFDRVVYRSADGGNSFAPAKAIARDTDSPIFYDEAFGDGASGVDLIQGTPSSAGFSFQNAPLDGSTATSTTRATGLFPFDSTKAGYAVTGALAGGKPLMVWRNATDGTLSWRASSAAGNDPATWSAAAALGAGDAPRLASGSTGTFLVSFHDAGNYTNQYEIRPFASGTFGAPVALGSPTTDYASPDAVVDAGGSLHVVFPAAGKLEYRHTDGTPNLGQVPTQHATTIMCRTPEAAIRLGANAAGPAFDQIGGFAVWSEVAANNQWHVRGASLEAVSCDTTPPGTTPPGDTTPPTMNIGRRLLMRKGVVSLLIGCQDAETTCTGAAELRRAPKRGSKPGASLGKPKRFKLAGGDSKNVKLKLSKTALKLFRKHNPLKVMVLVTAADAAGNSATNVHRALLYFHK